MYEEILILRGRSGKTLPNGDVGYAPIARSQESAAQPGTAIEIFAAVLAIYSRPTSSFYD
jgi:hypothetical protein